MYNLQARPAVSPAEDWMFVVWVLALSIVSYIVVSHPRYYIRLFNMLFNMRILRQVMREEVITRRSNLLLNLCFIMVAGMAGYIAVNYWNFLNGRGFSGIAGYLLFCAFIAAVYGLKQTVSVVVGFAAGADQPLREYRYQVMLTNRVAALLLLPLTLMASVSSYDRLEHWLMAALGLFAVLVVYRLGRGAIGAWSQGVPVAYILFYICTLEILPLAVGLKWLQLI